MGGLIGLFSKLFSGFSKTGIKQLLLGAGIGLASAGVSLVVINYFISKITEATGSIGYFLSHLCGGEVLLLLLLLNLNFLSHLCGGEAFLECF